jgi:calcineurin-like phosphoesterase family protein
VATFFTSDTHFGDHRTLNIHKRPFESVGEMNAVLVANWNAAIGPEDEVWHLGDFARTQNQIPQFLSGLAGRKHLVRGNNDPASVTTVMGWESVQNYRELELDGHRLVLCHYPFRSWNGQHRKSINLHGHSHGRLKKVARQVDVGVDAWDFRPIDLASILSARGMEARA